MKNRPSKSIYKEKKYDEAKKSFFNNEFSFSADRNFSTLSPASFEEFTAFLKVVSPKKSDTFIELGCGDGRYIIPLLQNGYQVAGVDFASQAIKSLERRAEQLKLQKKLTTITDDFSKENKKYKEKYDIGYMASTYYMLAETPQKRLKIFQSFLKTIKKGGKIVILDPNPLNPLFYPYYLFHPQVVWKIEKNFIYSNRWNMTQIMKKSKLKNIKVVPYGYLPGFLINKTDSVKHFNAFMSSIPLINLFSTFNFYYGEK